VLETCRSRFLKVLQGEIPSDRYPLIEWATWWGLTIERWETEGLPSGLSGADIKRHFGLDVDYQLWIGPFGNTAPPKDENGAYIADEADYERLLPHLYPDPVNFDRELWARRAEEQARGDVIAWLTLEGFFWWPRVLFGIEPHLYSFYDQPDLYKRICEDLLAYQFRCIDAFCEVIKPDFMTFAEDMSYNHGPMISKDLFDEFMGPYYRRIIAELDKRGIVSIIDSDGMVEPLVSWFEEVGLKGILPLERMAGVDVVRMRADHPEWIMIGGFDKTVMHLGEARIRAEFERLMLAVKSGRFVLSVDHQTPPGVSLEDYRLYVRLLKEYMAI
jgi:hypothetical protein